MNKKDAPGVVPDLSSFTEEIGSTSKDFGACSDIASLFGRYHAIGLSASGTGLNSGLPRVIPSVASVSSPGTVKTNLNVSRITGSHKCLLPSPLTVLWLNTWSMMLPTSIKRDVLNLMDATTKHILAHCWVKKESFREAYPWFLGLRQQ